jgi:hypothetical protein
MSPPSSSQKKSTGRKRTGAKALETEVKRLQKLTPKKRAQRAGELAAMTSGQLHDELAKFGLKEPRETDTGALTAMVFNRFDLGVPPSESWTIAGVKHILEQILQKPFVAANVKSKKAAVEFLTKVLGRQLI